MKIAILGSGAMGCLFGALLAEAGNEVTMICHRMTQAELIRESGIILTTDAAGTRAVEVEAGVAVEISGRFDTVVILTKSSQTAHALSDIRHILHDRITLVSLQNGLGNEQPLLDYASRDRVLIGNTFLNSNRVSDNEIMSHGTGVTALACIDPVASESLSAFGAVLEGSGLECVFGDRALSAIWRKICFNSAMSPVTTLLHLNNGGIVEVGAKDLVLAIAYESVCVAVALGVDVTYDEVRDMLERCWSEHREHVGSMCADYLSGRSTDIEFLNGELARRAVDVGVKAPLNAMLTELVRAQSRAQEIGCRLPERG